MLVITKLLRDMKESHGEDSPIGILAGAYLQGGNPLVLNKLHSQASSTEKLALESAFGAKDLNPVLHDVLNEEWANDLETPILEMHLLDGCAIDCWGMILRTDCTVADFGTGDERDVKAFQDVAKKQVRVFYFG